MRKTVPFGAPFWYHFPKGHKNSKAFSESVLVPLMHQNSALLGKEALFSKMMSQGHCFITLISLSVKMITLLLMEAAMFVHRALLFIT